MNKIKICDIVNEDYSNKRFNFDLVSENEETINIMPDGPYKEGYEIYILHFNLNHKKMKIESGFFRFESDEYCYYSVIDGESVCKKWYVAPKTNKGYEHLIKIAEIIVKEYNSALLKFANETSQNNIEAFKKLKLQAFK